MRCFLLLLLLTSGRNGGAQDSAQTYPVHGVVMNSITHQPIARALVEEQSDAVLTDSNGRFELQLPAQMVTITARRPGYDQTEETTHTIQVSANTPEVAFQLSPQAVITGHVELPEEADAAGIQIMAYRARMRHGTRTWEFSGTATARSDGSFRLVPPQPGTFVLQTAPLSENGGLREAIGDDQAKVFGYPSLSYPVGARQASEGGLKLARGQQLNVSMVLGRQEFHSVDISVKGMPDGVQPNLQLYGGDSMPLQFPVRWNPQSQQASAKLPDGPYSVVAELNGQTPLFGRADFQVAGSPLAGVSVTVLPLLPIAVSVHRNFVESDPTSIVTTLREGARSRQVELYPGISVGLEAVDGQAGGGNLQMIPGSSDRFNLQLTGTKPGSYWVQVVPQEGYVSTITSGGVDLAKEPLVVGPGGASQPIEITVRNDAGQIGCTVHSSTLQTAVGQPLFVFIYAIPLTAIALTPLQMGAPLNMESMLSAVPPGTYRVIALDQSINVDEVEKEDMDRYTSKGQTVTVEAGSKATVSLSVSHVNNASSDIVIDQ